MTSNLKIFDFIEIANILLLFELWSLCVIPVKIRWALIIKNNYPNNRSSILMYLAILNLIKKEKRNLDISK